MNFLSLSLVQTLVKVKLKTLSQEDSRRLKTLSQVIFTLPLIDPQQICSFPSTSMLALACNPDFRSQAFHSSTHKPKQNSDLRPSILWKYQFPEASVSLIPNTSNKNKICSLVMKNIFTTKQKKQKRLELKSSFFHCWLLKSHLHPSFNSRWN